MWKRLPSTHPAARPLRGAATAVTGAVFAFVGCGTPRPAVVDQPPSGLISADGRRERLELTGRDRQELLAAMRSVAPGYRITRTPTPAAAIDGRVRWADIPAAARAACREAEIAVVAATANADATAWTFSLRTIEDWPGTLHVERRPPPDHYAATASIGRFPDLPERRVRAEAVLDQLREKLLAYGRKRSWDETEGDAADASITTGSSAASERAAPASPPR